MNHDWSVGQGGVSPRAYWCVLSEILTVQFIYDVRFIVTSFQKQFLIQAMPIVKDTRDTRRAYATMPFNYVWFMEQYGRR